MDKMVIAKKLLKEAIAEETHQPVAALNDFVSFEEYGVESVMMVSIIRRLEEKFGELPKTLFFEYPTIHELAEYLVEEYSMELNNEETDCNDRAMDVDTLRDIATEQEVELVPFQTNTVDEFLNDKNQSDSVPNANANQDIAIIGISGRFPMANDMDAFWENVKEGKDCITEVPEELWDWRQYWNPKKGTEGKSYTKWGGFLDHIDKFDPLFFKISNLEAESLDPQERLFLETVYHTLEDAGYTKKGLNDSKVGVYVGAMWSQYQLYGVDRANAGSSVASIANRVSYYFDFNGPSIGLDTMCSSSITTVHLACESIKNGETDVAIAGGVNITVHPNKYLFLSKTGFASSDGRCRSFGEGGDGYVPGDGVGAILLKPLAKAKEDGDQIYAVIKGTAINHGGKTAGYTVPNPKAQTELIDNALTKAKIDPSTISYLETHGTGTELGDPIEIRALKNVFEKGSNNKQSCAIGSIKSNIGHLESAAGFAGIAKVIMQMKHKTLVPSIHAENLNPNIDFANTPFYVQRSLENWEQPFISINGESTPVNRRAGVSSFGAGGANGFVLLEEYVTDESVLKTSNGKEEQLIVFSARNEERLEELLSNFHDYLSIKDERADEPVKEEIDTHPSKNSVDNGIEMLADLLQINKSFIEEDDLLEEYGFNGALINEFSLLVNVEVNKLAELKTLKDLKELFLNKPGKNNIEKSDHEYDNQLQDIAFTLQVGREHMEARVATIVTSVEELKNNLLGYLNNKKSNFITGKITGKIPEVNEGDKKFIDNLIKSRNYKKLAKLWCKGVDIDWENMHENSIAKRVSLPLYPFAKERCWVNNPTLPNQEILLTHPLLGEIDIKSSIGESLVYKKYLDEQTIQRYLQVGDGENTIPAVALIDMLMSAGWEAESQGTLSSLDLNDHKALSIDDVLVTELKANEDELTITISTNNTIIAKATYKFEAVQQDIHNYQEKIQTIYANNYSEADLRTNFKHTNTGLKSLSFVDSEILCEFSISENGHTKQPLPYSVLNSLITSIKIYLQELNKNIETLSIGDIFINKEIKDDGYIYIKETSPEYFDAFILDSNGRCHGWLMNISFANQRVNVSEFFYKPVWTEILNQEIKTDKQKERENVLIIYPENVSHMIQMIKENFNEKNTYEIIIGTKTEIKSKKSWLIDGSDELALGSCISNINAIDQIYFFGGVNVSTWLPRTQKTFEKIQNQSTLALFRLVQALDEYTLTKNSIELKIITNNIYKVLDEDSIQPSTSTLVGLGKTINREYTNINVELIDIDVTENRTKQADEGLRKSLELMQTGIHGVDEYAIRSGIGYKMQLTAASLPPVKEGSFKENGVYVLIGGTGSVGVKISKYLAERYFSHIVWIGRTEFNEEISRKMLEVEELGGTVEYHSLDISNEQHTTKLFKKLLDRHIKLNGVIHSALSFSVGRIQGITEAELLSTLKAKVDGGLVLSKVLENIDLDFLLFFSSGESFNGNIGWGAYAAACNFKDALARHLRETRKYPVQVINWGFWQGKEDDNEKLLHAKGIYPITQEQGAEVIERVLTTNTLQLMALHVSDEVLIKMGIDVASKKEGIETTNEPINKKNIQSELYSSTSEVATTKQNELDYNYFNNDFSNTSKSITLVSEKIGGIFADVLKIDVDKFEMDVDLANYGVDSLIVINLHTALEEEMGDLPATIILEQPTINEISEYLIQNHFEQVNKMINIQQQVEINTDNKMEHTINNNLYSTNNISTKTGVVEDVEVIRHIEKGHINSFLESYGQLYQDKKLRNERNTKKYKEYELEDASSAGLVQMVIRTPSCDEVEVIIAGKGKPILFMPAVALTAPVWIKQFEHLRENYQLICIHAPSYGLSKPIEDSTTEGVSNVFIEVLDRLNLKEPVNIVASCFGSISATYLSRFHPEYVSTLSLVGGFYDNSDLPQIDMKNLKIEEIMQMVSTVSESLKNDFDSVIGNIDSSHTTYIAEIEEYSSLLLNSQCANPLIAMRYLNEMLTLSTFQWLPNIIVPTQCIYGDLDTVVDPKRSMVLNEEIPNSDIVKVNGAGHYPFLTHSDVFNPILENFLTENSK